MPLEEAFSLAMSISGGWTADQTWPSVYVHDQMASDFVCPDAAARKNMPSSKQVAQLSTTSYVHIMDRITSTSPAPSHLLPHPPVPDFQAGDGHLGKRIHPPAEN